MQVGWLPLRRLKEETSDLHALAERYVRILDVDASREDYVRYLRAMLGYHAPIEEMFAVAPALVETGFATDIRRRAHLLEGDLAALDVTGPFQRCEALPDASSLPALLGCAYVLEGSTLGGRYILTKLPPALAELRGVATNFLTGYGPDTGARWREFAAIVERELRSDSDIDAAVAGARATFARLVDWLALHEAPDARRGMRYREAS